MMRREPSFKGDEFIIWSSSLVLAVMLGALAAYALAIAAGAAAAAASSSFKEMLVLIGAGISLIALALQGRLVRAFLVSFGLAFFVGLAIATHLRSF
ncbi:MAG: hypothetical protein M3N19_06165 [Candidatus Eremiobacteraeota bacterium]|nr:hypothetical protein [Candidatus Eremiobacteraeota bacterium]